MLRFRKGPGVGWGVEVGGEQSSRRSSPESGPPLFLSPRVRCASRYLAHLLCGREGGKTPGPKGRTTRCCPWLSGTGSGFSLRIRCHTQAARVPQPTPVSISRSLSLSHSLSVDLSPNTPNPLPPRHLFSFTLLPDTCVPWLRPPHHHLGWRA